jgi:proline iminopeptidase
MAKKIFLFVFLSLFGHSFAQTEGFSKNTDSSQTYYKIFGEGTPILIINGGPGMNSNGFEPMAKILAEKYQTIVYDQRGTGKSKSGQYSDILSAECWPLIMPQFTQTVLIN